MSASPPRALLGMALAFGGVAIIALGASAGVEGDLLGVLLCVAAALSYAIGGRAGEAAGRAPPRTADLVGACTVGALVCLPFAEGLHQEALLASPTDLGWLVFLGIGPTAVAFTTFAYALKYMNASALAITTYLIPPLTIVLSMVLLSATPPASAYLGGTLALVGVAGRTTNGTGSATDTLTRQTSTTRSVVGVEQHSRILF